MGGRVDAGYALYHHVTLYHTNIYIYKVLQMKNNKSEHEKRGPDGEIARVTHNNTKPKPKSLQISRAHASSAQNQMVNVKRQYAQRK